jgi:uncharacterized protein YbjT (DUF2867 family)
MIVVLNAGGNIGSELVTLLKERGADFVAGYRSAERAAAATASGTRATVADFARPETLRTALTGASAVFYVCPPAPNLAELEGNVVDAARSAGVKHLVKLSVWGADEGEFLFARLHGEVERRIIGSGIPYTFLRPTGFMQNILGQAATIKSQGAFYLPGGDARVAEIDYRDIARVAAAALLEPGHEGRAYALTGPEAMTYAERATVLSDVLARPVSFVPVPESDWKGMAVSSGLPEWQADGIIDLSRYYRSGASGRVSPDVEQVTGAPPRTYRQFVTDYAGALR